MIDLHFWPTPNGLKITLFLEETGLPYRIVPVDISRGDQFKPEFLAISPNNRMPAIVDHEPLDGGAPLSIFESAAILLYLAEKTGRFAGTDLRSRVAVNEWLAWQVGGLGPMLGQANHFTHYAPEKIPYGIERYHKEAVRLAGVMNTRLGVSKYLAGPDYTIADMASYPWTTAFERLPVALEPFANLRRWMAEIAARPATERGMAVRAQAG